MAMSNPKCNTSNKAGFKRQPEELGTALNVAHPKARTLREKGATPDPQTSLHYFLRKVMTAAFISFNVSA